MKLPKPFYRLPVRFDAARLAAECAAMPAAAWAKHPNEIPGNTSLRLISANGTENDEVDGPMLPTAHLARAPYLRQVLASFGVVWSRSRLLKLSARAGVPRHADINHHWFSRVRLHVPVVTHPEVRFHCGDRSVHMAAGEAWLFDNWRLHWVEMYRRQRSTSFAMIPPAILHCSASESRCGLSCRRPRLICCSVISRPN